MTLAGLSHSQDNALSKSLPYNDIADKQSHSANPIANKWSTNSSLLATSTTVTLPDPEGGGDKGIGCTSSSSCFLSFFFFFFADFVVLSPSTISLDTAVEEERGPDKFTVLLPLPLLVPPPPLPLPLPLVAVGPPDTLFDDPDPDPPLSLSLSFPVALEDAAFPLGDFLAISSSISLALSCLSFNCFCFLSSNSLSFSSLSATFFLAASKSSSFCNLSASFCALIFSNARTASESSLATC